MPCNGSGRQQEDGAEGPTHDVYRDVNVKERHRSRYAKPQPSPKPRDTADCKPGQRQDDETLRCPRGNRREPFGPQCPRFPPGRYPRMS